MPLLLARVIAKWKRVILPDDSTRAREEGRQRVDKRPTEAPTSSSSLFTGYVSVGLLKGPTVFATIATLSCAWYLRPSPRAVGAPDKSVAERATAFIVNDIILCKLLKPPDANKSFSIPSLLKRCDADRTDRCYSLLLWRCRRRVSVPRVACFFLSSEPIEFTHTVFKISSLWPNPHIKELFFCAFLVFFFSAAAVPAAGG